MTTTAIPTDTNIQLRGLVKSFRSPQGMVHAVRGIDVAIGAGETVALLGPNGAGKSTTIDMLLGLPGVGSAERRGGAIVLHCGDSDATIRALLQAYPGVRDIEIGGAGLKQAFLQLTGVAGAA